MDCRVKPGNDEETRSKGGLRAALFVACAPARGVKVYLE